MLLTSLAIFAPPSRAKISLSKSLKCEYLPLILAGQGARNPRFVLPYFAYSYERF